MAVPSKNRTIPLNPSVAALSAMLDKQRQQLVAVGGKLPQEHKSNLNKILDVVSRPGQMVTGAISKPVQHMLGVSKEGEKEGKFQGPSPGILKDILTGGWEGLSGHRKGGYADIIQAGAVGLPKNPMTPVWRNRVFQTGMGLAGDIALDPTTYLSFGLTKAAPAIETGAKLGQVLSAGVGAEEALGGAVKVKKSAKFFADLAEATRAAEKPGAVTMRIGTARTPWITKEFTGPYAAAAKVHDVASKAARAVGVSDTLKNISKGARQRSLYPGDLHQEFRAGQQRGVAHVMDREAVLNGKNQYNIDLRNLTKNERKELAVSIAHGTKPAFQTSQRGIDMNNAMELIRDQIFDLDHMRFANGIERPQQGMMNHVPMYPSKADLKGSKNADFQKFLMKQRKAGKPVASYLEAQKRGLNPSTDIYEILRSYAAETERAIQHKELLTSGLNHYATSFLKPKGKAAGLKYAVEEAKKADLVPLDRQLLKGSHWANDTKGMYIPRVVQEALLASTQAYHSSEEASAMLRTVDKAIRFWKTGVTTLNPAHYTNNLMGDTFLNWVGGLRHPSDVYHNYKDAAQIIARRGKAEAGKGFKIGELDRDAADIHNLYKEHGALGGTIHESVKGTTETGGLYYEPYKTLGEKLVERPGIQRLQGEAIYKGAQRAGQIARRGYSEVQHIGQTSEDFTRMANFMFSMRKYHKEIEKVTDDATLQKAAKYAAERVRKYNLDYGDLTRQETYARRVVPFYTYMRRAAPLMMETIALHPDIVSRIPKYQNAVERLLGTDPGHNPITERVPKFIRDSAAIRLRGERGGKNPLYFDPRLPLADIVNFLPDPNEPASEFMRRAFNTTIFRGGIEAATNKSTLTGASLGNPTLAKQLASQTPLSRYIYDKFQPGGPAKIQQPGDVSDKSFWGRPSVRLLSPVHPRVVTPTAQRGEERRRQDPIAARLKVARAKRINAALRG